MCNKRSARASHCIWNGMYSRTNTTKIFVLCSVFWKWTFWTQSPWSLAQPAASGQRPAQMMCTTLAPNTNFELKAILSAFIGYTPSTTSDHRRGGGNLHRLHSRWQIEVKIALLRQRRQAYRTRWYLHSMNMNCLMVCMRKNMRRKKKKREVDDWPDKHYTTAVAFKF